MGMKVTMKCYNKSNMDNKYFDFPQTVHYNKCVRSKCSAGSHKNRFPAEPCRSGNGEKMDKELVVVIDFGGQYNQLVARRVRECNVYCEIYSYKTDLAKIKAMNPKGIILTGGPSSCYEEGAARCSNELFAMGIPVLGLCYGAQLMMHVLGGKVEKAPVRELSLIQISEPTRQ